MGKRSIFYKSGRLYNLLITGFYGKKKKLRYQAVANQIQKDDFVFDIGCGPGTLVPYLPTRRYKGIDLNPDFIKELKSREIDAEIEDAFNFDCYPQGDDIVYTCIDMMHHFKPRDIEWLEQARDMNIKMLIICESSLIKYRNKIVDWFIDRISRIIDDDGYSDIDARLETPHYSNEEIRGFAEVIKQSSKPCIVEIWEKGTEVVIIADYSRRIDIK